ncbi:MAG: AMIN domain-containing protein, partial [Candidatus Aminicenantes bacterium]|nr:AMIN domain-containing protein [Candidatus Aminicenantes bacterium]
MKRKAYWLLFTTLSLVVVFAGHGHGSPAAATINKITAQPGQLNNWVVLETDNALALTRTFYADKTLVLELDRVDLTAQPQIQTADAPLVTAIKLEQAGAGRARLSIQLREPVPYTVTVEDNRTVVALSRIQRGPGDPPIEAEVEQQLDKSAGSTVFMNSVNMEDKEGEVQFRAKLSGGTVSQVFTLENPLRLVVDVFNAVYEEPASFLPVDRYGLKKLRVAQFQLSNPRSITRMVFDLKEPLYYSLRSDSGEIVVSFNKSETPVLASA